MKTFLSAACALTALALAGSAFADGTVTATLQQPVAKPVKIIAAHAVFNCEGTTCIASAAPDDANDAYACKDVARQMGPIASYQEFKALDDKALAKCNTAAPKPKTVTASAK